MVVQEEGLDNENPFSGYLVGHCVSTNVNQSATAFCLAASLPDAYANPYEVTPIPLVIVSKFNEIKEVSKNSKAVIINDNPQSALQFTIQKFGPNVLIEGGPNLLLEIIDLVDELYITIANRYGDGQIVSFDGLTREFIMEEMEKIEGEIFYRFIRER